MQRALVCVLYVCLLLLHGCALASVVAGVGQPTNTSGADFNRLARSMPPLAADLEKNRCLNGYYTGKSVQALLSDGRTWGTATNKRGPGKLYTIIYIDYTKDSDSTIDWYEHWYQLYDYDQDGKIDDCKYYKIHKGTQTNVGGTRHEEFVKKFDEESADYKKRHGLKF